MRRHPGLATPDVDCDVPAVIVKVGHYPIHHGGVDAIRSLGRLGVPVHAVTEDRWTPAALSRYCQQRFVWPKAERADPELMVKHLKEAGQQIGTPSMLIPTDEEAAVLIAENSTELSEYFLLPQVAPDLPARLGSKRGLYELCLEHDVPAPASVFPQTLAEIEEFAARASFPVVAKNQDAWVRLHHPVVNGTTIIDSAGELITMARDWGDTFSVILQEYIPADAAEDWIVHLYRGAGGDPLVLFTGIKVRSWPPQAGMTALAYTVSNPKLAELAAHLCEQVGFAGIADLDFRFDRRDGQYKLVDFNPRIGAQFRLFENAAGIDVVRAMHLDLTGRPVPSAPMPEGRRIIVENVDLTSRMTGKRSSYNIPPLPQSSGGTELAWWAADDPMPVAMMLARSAAPLATYINRLRRRRTIRRDAQEVTQPAAAPAAPLPKLSGQQLKDSTDVSLPGRGSISGRDPMPPTTTTHAPAVVIGAGPYGLSVAAHLRGRGIAVRTFGDVMSGWHSQMPAGMFLKSTPSASSLSAPGTGSRLEDFCIVSGVTPLVGDDVVPIDLFIRYGQWFAERNVPDVENVKVTGLKRDGHLHLVTLATGEQISTPVVVLATGMSGAAHVAPELSALGEPAADGVLSHSSQHTSLDGFAGREVAVIGAGQSALENAALLHEAGARVQIISRSPVVWGGDPVVREGVSRYLPEVGSPLGPDWRLIPFSSAPGAFRYLPDATRLALVRRVLGPFGAWWLKPRVVGQFDVHEGQRVTSARAVGDNALLTTTSVTGHQSEFKFDHVLSATGFRVNLANLGFMDPALMSQFRSIVGCPRLSGSFESSVPGIYFAGLAASSTFGPLMRFVCGAEFAAGKVTNSAAARIRAVSRM